MECYCESIQFQHDDDYLLDDKNTQPLLQTEINIEKNCSICKFRMLPDKIVNNRASDDTQLWPIDINYSNNDASTNKDDLKFPMHLRSVSPPVSGDSADSSLLCTSNDTDLCAIEEYHCHHSRKERSQHWALKRLIVATAICIIFMFAEIVGGIISESLALMTDAAHMLLDAIGCSVALSAIYISKKQPTKKYPFGFYRAEVLGALISVLFLWGLTIIFIYLAYERLRHGHFEIKSKLMLIIATMGLGINVLQIIVLHGLCFGKQDPSMQMHHGHSHNINIRAAALHVVGDLLQSVGVVIAAVTIMLYPNWKIIDPILTFLFSILVLITSRTVFMDAVNALMESFPAHLSYDQIYTTLIEIPGVKHVHNLQAWTLTFGVINLSVHLAVDDTTDKETVLKIATIILRDDYEIHQSTVQVESYTETVMSTCSMCQQPKGN